MKGSLMSSYILLSSIGIILILSTFVKCQGQQCLSKEHFICHNGKCIPNSWKCDKDDDCGDASDEKSCVVSTCSKTEFVCNNGKCIPNNWFCDLDDDCGDGSDENKTRCEKKTCPSDKFECGPGQKCISKDWVCDEQSDCPNGLDEQQNCTVAATCLSNEFKCASSSKCIPHRFKCDQDNDCDDGSDEKDCVAPECSQGYFMCETKKNCIPMKWRCDGDVGDCTDNSDEKNCHNSTIRPSNTQCGSSHFKCGDGLCIHEAWKCDGDFDCTDQSDEEHCSDTCIKENKFMCVVQKNCIYKYMVCDGQQDCQDNSDELGCEKKNFCDPKTHFKCSVNTTGMCIPLSKVCDDSHDCPRSEDEYQMICPRNKWKSCDSSPCKQKTISSGSIVQCHNLPRGFYCSCSPGYTLDKDSVTCIDVDECKFPATCSSHFCKNREGGYKCECYPGYDLDPVTNLCKATHGHMVLMYSHRHTIQTYNFSDQQDRTIVQNTHSAVAIDFDIVNNMVYWTDVATERLYGTPLPTSNTPRDAANATILLSNLGVPDGLALDWVYQNIYWSDTKSDTISVYSIRSKTSKVLFGPDLLDEPRAIVVDPRTGNMYWCDWGDTKGNPAIYQAGLDGSAMHKLVYGADVVWPNGLTIDYVTGVLYWIDAKLHNIGSYKLSTGNYRQVYRSFIKIKHPFAISVFEDNLFWSDWDGQYISSVNKFTGKNVTDIKVGLVMDPMDVHVFHTLKQPYAVNHCKSMKCSHMCLPTPLVHHSMDAKDTPNQAYVRCDCPAGLTLQDDKRTCNKSGVVTVKPTGKVVSTISPPTTSAPISSTDVKAQDRKSFPEKDDTGRIAGITVGVIVVVIVILVLIGIIAYRYTKRRHIKSMNFDNPVYRKTTTADQIIIEKSQYQPNGSGLPPALQPLTDPSNVNIV